ncbi:dynamin family protein [Roseovarius sp. CAU 1744]|uniref:dynamin family protein n=1 Tax=Roseovarius sp. CAU 1744 TaxID=3140368 RepID=UPI00325B7157
MRNEQTQEMRKAPRPKTFVDGLEQLAQFADEVGTLRNVLDELSGLTGEDASKAVARLSKELEEFEPTVTVLGQVKAGKTALVNAMAGWAELLPSDVNPWTSVVTSLHLRPGTDQSKNAARFRFMTEEEWDRLLGKGGRMGELAGRAGAESELQKIGEQIELVREKARQRLGRKFELLIGEEHEYGYFDKNLLEKYICLGDDFDLENAQPDTADQGRFADILRSADLNLSSAAIPINLCLRDTPGVNDTFMMREQITVQAVRDSRFCVLVLSANQALSSVDMGLIRLISNLKSRNIVIFVNRIDELTAPAEQIPEIEKSIRQTLKSKQGPEDVEIVFGSACWAGAVLSGDIEKLPKGSSKALLEWAEKSLDSRASKTKPVDIVWELSGLPALFRALSERIVTDLGTPFIQKIASSAITIATSQQAADKIRVSGVADSSISVRDAMVEFDRLCNRHIEALQVALAPLADDYHVRVDRAHVQFIERAVQSLISHLELYGPLEGWKYDPTGLRVLVRSAYSVFGRKVRKLALKRYEAALVDVATIYARTFGEAVEGIQLGMPAPPHIPAPVALGQTIALDFNDGWWVSWWKRLRGYEAFAKQFRQLISAETEEFMTQLKSEQSDLVCHQFVSVLREFFINHKDIFAEISAGASRGGDISNLVDRDGATQGAALDELLSTLRARAA